MEMVRLDVSEMSTDLLTLPRIFIIEGIVTICVSLASWPLIVPFPENATFLKPEEKELLLARTKVDGGNVSREDISFRMVLHHLKDWRIWAGYLFFYKLLLYPN